MLVGEPQEVEEIYEFPHFIGIPYPIEGEDCRFLFGRPLEVLLISLLEVQIELRVSLLSREDAADPLLGIAVNSLLL